MERLTEVCWKNLDPWECCGQDNYCKRGCHDEGGCTKGCIVPKLYDRLAAYEDTGLEPEEIMNFVEKWEQAVELAGICKQNDVDRLKELLQAEKDGRLSVEPPNEPLTLEELQEMDGEPVWCINGNDGQWGLAHVFSAEGETYVECVTKTGFTMDKMTYGAMGTYAWLAYRHKPEEEAT